jgi:hypothetical protein
LTVFGATASSACHVFAPMWPSSMKPLERWKRFTARRVLDPK